jgi:hypothetical protein
VDLDDDGYYGGEAKVVVKGGGIIDLGDQPVDAYRQTVPGNSTDMTLTTPKSKMDEGTVDEVVTFTLTGTTTGSAMVNAYVKNSTSTGLAMKTLKSNTDVSKGMSNYGALVTHTLNANDPSRIDVQYPSSQRLPKVSVQFKGQCKK